MRTVLLFIALLTTTTYCLDHLDVRNDDDSALDALKLYHIRRLLHRAKNTNNQRLEEMKNEISNNEQEEYDAFQKEMDKERGDYRKQYAEHTRASQNTNNDGATGEDDDPTVPDPDVELEPAPNADNDQEKEHHRHKSKRIYEYKWKHGIPHTLDKLYQREKEEIEEEKQDKNDDGTIVAADAMAHPVVIKSLPMQPLYEPQKDGSNAHWSKMTFWLLMTILFINAFAILYCIYGRQMMAHCNANAIQRTKQLSGEDDICESDGTDEEEYNW
eukprot:179065_1